MLKQQKGITLVALVITVIVLLILAGVSMSLITGDGGLFGRASDSATAMNGAAANEANMFTNYMTFLNTYYNNSVDYGTPTTNPGT